MARLASHIGPKGEQRDDGRLPTWRTQAVARFASAYPGRRTAAGVIISERPKRAIGPAILSRSPPERYPQHTRRAFVVPWRSSWKFPRSS